MAFFSRLRTNLNLNQLKHRYFASSSILASGNNAPLTSKEKTRAALTLLKSESNPERILEICRAASLTPDTHLDRLAFSLAIDKLSEANHFNGISQFLEELKTRPDSHRNERLIAHTIILYGQAKMTDHAVRTFKEMDKYGLRHSVRAFNALLFSFLLANEHKEVKRIFLELPKMYGIEPDMDTYNKVIKSCAESGDTSSGYSILAEMDRKSIKPNATSFQILLAGFYQERKFDDVGKVLQMIEKYGMKPRLSIYNTRILGLCKLKKSAEAKALLDGMLSRGMKPNKVTYNHLIYGFCKEGNLEEAKKLYKIMINGGFKPDRECYSTLVYFLCQGGDYETALMVCKQSIEKSWVPNFTTMKSLVEGLASVSKVAEAKELVGLVKTKFTNNVEVWNEVEAKLPQ